MGFNSGFKGLKTGLEGMDYRFVWLRAGINCRFLILL